MSKNTQISELINYISIDGSGNVVLSSGQLVATQNYVSTAISNLVASAPTTLDTLNELATALGNDPNFATTIATSIGTKQAQLNGTGFVKVTGTTVSYDNSTYLTTSSASSTYLPLSGGTLTGSLNGTSATFSSSVTAASFTDGYITMSAAQINRTSATVELQYGASGNVRFFGGGSYPITFTASTGAATFSSDVTIGGLYTFSSWTTGTINKIRGYLGNDDKSIQWMLSNSPAGTLIKDNNSFLLSVNGTNTIFGNSFGNVGISTVNPTNGKLEVQQTATTAGLWVQTGGTTSSYVIADFRTGTNASALQILGNTNSIFGGSIGVGTNIPGYNIDIQGTEAKLNLQSTGTGGISWVTASTYNAWSAGGGKYVITTNGGTAGIKFTIDANGSIGIGTYSPYGGISGTEVALHISNTNVAVLALESGAASGRKYQIYSSNDGALYFRDGSTGNQRIAISANGHFMVGTTTDYSFWPSWDGGVIRIGQGGVIWHYRDSALDFMISSNYYISTSGAQETRIASGGSANIYMNNGNILLRTGASGSAGSSISWQNALNLTNAGDAIFGYATQQQGLWTVINVGFTVGNQAFTFDVGVGDEGGGGNIFKVEAGFAHYSSMGYNCLAEFYISTRGTSSEITDVKRVDTGNGGSFTAWKTDASTLRVAKTAGTYPGGGRYWIRVTKVTY